MKSIFTLLTLLVSFSSFAQENSRSYDELMKRSRRAKTTAIIMVSTGPVIAAGGIGTLIYGLLQRETADRDYYYDQNGNYVELPAKKYTGEIVGGAAATLVGLGVALGSIAFSNKADDLRRDARKIKLKTSTGRVNIPGLQNSYGRNGVTQYKLSLLVSLGK